MTAITETTFDRVALSLAETFTIARGSTDVSEAVTVALTDEEGRVGYGAAGPSAYYEESADSAAAAMPELLATVEGTDPTNQQRIARRLAETAPDEAAARAAVSIAVHDLAARGAGEPLYRRLGLDPGRTPVTSYTVGIDTPAGMADRARRAREAGYPVLKVKLGTEDDRARFEAVRSAAPEARIRVDANTAWDREQARESLEWLAAGDVEFVEQPLPADDLDGLSALSEGPLPIAADESCVTAADVPAVADAVDLVVVKLMKCGGIRPALSHIQAAHAHGLDVMLGCMSESAASIAGGCHLSPLVEYADLDGSLLLADDPYEGVPMPDGRIDLEAVETGTGVAPTE